MAAIITSKYQKTGAVFADAEQARASKNSMYTPELTASIDSCNQTMLNNGVLTGPLSYTWDPVTFILGIVKPVSSAEAYYNAKTFDGQACVVQAADAGWTYLEDDVVPA